MNGELFDDKKLKSAAIEDLLAYFNLNKSRVAIEINGQIIKKSDYESLELKSDDKVEIIHFVGGGK